MTLVLYAHLTWAAAVERHCRQNVAYRVITGNLLPDHATIARFVVRLEGALADLFGEVLRLCVEAGLLAPEVIAIDGTRMAGNASSDATRNFGQLAREMPGSEAPVAAARLGETMAWSTIVEMFRMLKLPCNEVAA